MQIGLDSAWKADSPGKRFDHGELRGLQALTVLPGKSAQAKVQRGDSQAANNLSSDSTQPSE